MIQKCWTSNYSKTKKKKKMGHKVDNYSLLLLLRNVRSHPMETCSYICLASQPTFRLRNSWMLDGYIRCTCTIITKIINIIKFDERKIKNYY